MILEWKLKKTQETLKFTKTFLSDGVKTWCDGVMKAEVQGTACIQEVCKKLNGEDLVTASEEGHHK